MNEDLSDKIQERISKIKPLSRRHFLLLRCFFWLLAVLSVIVGSLAVSTIIFLLADYRRHGLFLEHHNFSEFIMMIPFVWIIVFMFFLFITDKSIRHTKEGYRYKLSHIIIVILTLSVIFGAIFNYVGIGKNTHELMNRVPFYDAVTYDSKDAWNRPDVGRIAGNIISINDKANFSIMDFRRHAWRVSLARMKDNFFVPKVNTNVRIAGSLDAPSGIFFARSIHLWEQ